MTQLKVAIDARRLHSHRLGGIGRYVQHLSSRFSSLAPDLEFVLLTDRIVGPPGFRDGCRQVVLGQSYEEGSALAKAYSPFWMNCLVPHFLARERIDLFHGTNYALPYFWGGTHYVATIHDIAFVRVPRTFSLLHRTYLRSLVSFGVRRADHIIVGSNDAKDDLARMTGVGSTRVSVIHHGIEDSYSADANDSYLERVRGELGLPLRYVLHVGVVEKKKNIETLLKACTPLVRERVLDAVVLAGRDGRGADDVRRMAHQLNIKSNTMFLGYVAQDLMRGLYSLASVLVFPSWFEGFGLPVLEAMACGTPVVASNSSSIPEVAGDAALLFPPEAPDALQDALRAILLSVELRNRLRARGLSRAAAFSWDESARRHIDVYRRVLNDSLRATEGRTAPVRRRS